MRYLFAFILLIHGLIHLMGFVKAFKLGEVSQLSGHFSKPAGLMWLVAALLFIAAVAAFLLKNDGWWMPAAAAVVLSQILIFTQWNDAKFGTIANIIALLVLIPAFGQWRFNSMIQQELAVFMPRTVEPAPVLTREMAASLPPVVQQWLERSNAIGNPLVKTAHLYQKGEMRTTPDGKWMPVESRQFITVDKPGFFWTADVQAAPMVSMIARDKYENGKGYMTIKLLSLFPVADAKGPETDQGAMVRYLAEICWLPSAALSTYITWEQVDSTSAKATMRYGGIEASAVFTFTPEGDMKSIEAMRYYDHKGGPTLEKWHISIDPDGYRVFEGLRIPAISSVAWRLKDGDFTWYKLEITDIRYNEPYRPE